MARRPNPVPSYRLHKQSGQAIVTVRTPAGDRRDVLLGTYNSPESRADYARIVAELATSPTPGAIASKSAAPDVTVNEVLIAFWHHAQQHYRRPDGTATSELWQFKVLCRTVRELYGHTPSAEFGPLALRAVRQRMVDAGLCRRVVNKRVSRAKTIFKWAAAHELVPVATYQALSTLAGLQKGRTSAPDPEPVGPVDDAHVEATLPYLRSEVAAMVQVQRLTGMRPGEVCRLRPADVDQTLAVWLYTPAGHKMAHKGRARVIAIGPKARAVLAPFWPADPHAYVFSPRKVVETFHAERSAARTTPRYASHMARNAGKRVNIRKRPPAARYPTQSYRTAVHRGIDRANADRARHDVPEGHHGPNLPRVPEWGPNQLRHSHATEVRRRYGLEAAGASLGHAKMSATEVYAERDLGLALRVATEMG